MVRSFSGKTNPLKGCHRDAMVLKIAGFLDENPYSIGPPAQWDLTLDQGFWNCLLLDEDGSILLIFAVSPAMLGGGIREPRQRGTLRPKCWFPQNESYGNSHEKCLFHRHQPTYQLVRIPIITRVGNVASTVISNPHIHTLLVLPTLDHRFSPVHINYAITNCSPDFCGYSNQSSRA